jgi:alpha-galactosidase
VDLNSSLPGLCALLSLSTLMGCSEGSGKISGPGGGADDEESSGGASGAPAEMDDYFPVPEAEGLAPTPPMGWNSWNRFGCGVRADLIELIAEAMATNGMQEAGYEYVNIDDCWSREERAEDGTLQVASSFADGIGALADHVHGLGLKLGIYGDRGTETCAGRAGSYGYEPQDATTFAEWGVDYLKYDNCSPVVEEGDPEYEAAMQEDYERMGQALRDAGRDMVYSLCAWGFYEWGVGLGQLWRTTTDITPTWGSILDNAKFNKDWAAYAGPNGWNDPDMLEVGNTSTDPNKPSMTLREQRAHFSLWAIMAAPLIAGNDLREGHLDPEVLDILTNDEVIAINQDPLGLQGVRVRDDQDLSVWAKPLNESGARAVLLLNERDADADMTVSFEEVGLGPGSATVRDLWQHEDLGSFQDSYSTVVASHEGVTLKITGTEPPPPSGTVYLSDLTWTYAANRVGPVEKDQSNGDFEPGDGDPLALGGEIYDKGLGVWAPSKIIYRLGKSCTRFSAELGIDDSTDGRGSVIFHVFADGEKLYESEVLTGESAAQSVEVDVTDRHRLTLLVTNALDGYGRDRANWADATLECEP